jgi:RND family efflux transporter MFP subunit
MKKNSRKIAAIIILLLIFGFIVIKLLNNKKDVENKVYHKNPDHKVSVQADTVKLSSLEENSAFLGAFVPVREVIIAAEAGGKISAVNIQEGSMVGTGSSIARMDTELLEAQLRSAMASYENAAATLKRYQQATNGITALQIDNARTQELTGKAQIDQLRKQIRMCDIRAPFGGIITSKSFELGAVVGVGTQLAQLADMSNMKLEISVPEKSIVQFSKGQKIRVTTDIYPDKIFSGVVDMVASKADESRNYKVKILTDNPSMLLKAGMYGRIVSDKSYGEKVTVPRSSLVGSSSHPQVFVIENGVSKLRDITIGSGNESRVEIASGLKAGEIVASGGLVNLSDGSKVAIAK